MSCTLSTVCGGAWFSGLGVALMIIRTWFQSLDRVMFYVFEQEHVISCYSSHPSPPTVGKSEYSYS